MRRGFCKTLHLGRPTSAFRWLPRKPGKAVTGGIVSSRAFSGAVIYINDRWYAFRDEFNPLEILYKLMDTDLVNALVERTHAAVELVAQSGSFDDTRAFNEESVYLFPLPISDAL